MAAIRARLGKIRDALLGTNKALNRARGRWKKQHDRAHKNRNRALEAGKKADAFRKAGEPGKAAKQDRAAAYFHLRAQKAHVAAQLEIAAVKRLNQKAKGLAASQSALKAKLAKLSKRRRTRSRSTATPCAAAPTGTGYRLRR